MRCGVKFCGGCNPRYDREEVFRRLKERFAERVSAASADGSENEGLPSAELTAENRLDFEFAREGIPYDILLVIGGCSACCATYGQYEVRGEVLKMWEEAALDETVRHLECALDAASVPAER